MAKPPPKYGALDRMEIELAGLDVVAMARALHHQVGMLWVLSMWRPSAMHSMFARSGQSH